MRETQADVRISTISFFYNICMSNFYTAVTRDCCCIFPKLKDNEGIIYHAVYNIHVVGENVAWLQQEQINPVSHGAAVSVLVVKGIS